MGNRPTCYVAIHKPAQLDAKQIRDKQRQEEQAETRTETAIADLLGTRPRLGTRTRHHCGRRLGDYGTGKTVFTQMLAYQLAPPPEDDRGPHPAVGELARNCRTASH